MIGAGLRLDWKMPTAWLTLAFAIGVGLRFAVAMRGYNYDIESYRIVADIMARGGNVYAETTRYNYGPIWAWLLHLLDQIPFAGNDPLWSLRWKVTAFLTAVDVGTAILLLRWYGTGSAAFLLLNPISIIITGYHGQFDSLAIIAGLAAVRLGSSEDSRHLLPGLAMLGLSLAIKHILFLFPLWLAMRQDGARRRLICLAIPVTIFLVGFVPYVADGASGILANVFMYRSFPNAPFWTGVAPQVLAARVPAFLLFLGTMTVLGFLWRRKPVQETLLLYLVAVVVFSSAMVNQYLAIAVLTIAIRPNLLYLGYTLAAGAYLTASANGLHSSGLERWIGTGGASPVVGYGELVFLLFLGLVMHWTSMNRPLPASSPLSAEGRGDHPR
jgi:hypothetical protein